MVTQQDIDGALNYLRANDAKKASSFDAGSATVIVWRRARRANGTYITGKFSKNRECVTRGAEQTRRKLARVAAESASALADLNTKELGLLAELAKQESFAAHTIETWRAVGWPSEGHCQAYWEMQCAPAAGNVSKIKGQLNYIAERRAQLS